jgi:predicted amidohydrolase YtcJ
MEDVKRIQAFQLEKIKLYCWKRMGPKWENKRVSFKAILDKYFPNIPVVLNRVDGHAIIVNSKALALAGVTKDTKAVGGQIEIKMANQREF